MLYISFGTSFQSFNRSFESRVNRLSEELQLQQRESSELESVKPVTPLPRYIFFILASTEIVFFFF